MSNMMGRRKHWGRWSIDRDDSNRAARTQEKRAWVSDSGQDALLGLIDTPDAPEGTDPPTTPPSPLHAPGSGTP